jgi:hypothetical protein
MAKRSGARGVIRGDGEIGLVLIPKVAIGVALSWSITPYSYVSPLAMRLVIQ